MGAAAIYSKSTLQLAATPGRKSVVTRKERAIRHAYVERAQRLVPHRPALPAANNRKAGSPRRCRQHVALRGAIDGSKTGGHRACRHVLLVASEVEEACNRHIHIAGEPVTWGPRRPSPSQSHFPLLSAAQCFIAGHVMQRQSACLDETLKPLAHCAG